MSDGRSGDFRFDINHRLKFKFLGSHRSRPTPGCWPTESLTKRSDSLMWRMICSMTAASLRTNNTASRHFRARRSRADLRATKMSTTPSNWQSIRRRATLLAAWQANQRNKQLYQARLRRIAKFRIVQPRGSPT